MPKIQFKKGEDFKIIAGLLIILLVLSLPFAYFKQAEANGSVTITTSVAATLQFNTVTGPTDEFGTTTPGTAKFATTTLVLSTNDTLGWITSLSGDTKVTGFNNLELLNASSTSIPDQTEWIPGTSTSTTPGNATSTGNLINSGNVLAFRVMTASSTNGGAFISTTWWGTQDNYSNNTNTLWAGIASSTVQRTIGNAGAGSYSASPHLNTVNYYLNPPLNQPSGNYIAPVTFTAVGN